MYLTERIKSGAEEFSSKNGDTYANENLFDVFAQRLFKRSDFDLLYAKTRRDDLDDERMESAENLDFQFWHKRSGHTFWVVCKFRSDYYGDKLDWYHPDQIKYYKQLQEDVWPEKIYVVIGFGRRPLQPSFMFCIPLDEVENYGIDSSILEKHERDPTQPFDYQKGRLV